MTTPARPDPAARIATQGIAVVRDVFDPGEVAAATAALDRAFASEADIAGERGWLTDGHRVTYALPVKDPLFVALCTHPRLVALARSVLGDDCRVAGCNGLDVPAGGVGQPLHRDHPVPLPGTTTYLHVVCALDPFTAGNGGTRVVPASHRGSLAQRDAADLELLALPVDLGAGDAVAFDASLVHAAGANRGRSPRRALHVLFARPWVQPHWDLPASFAADAAAALTDEQRELLGFVGRPRRFDLDGRRVVR